MTGQIAKNISGGVGYTWKISDDTYGTLVPTNASNVIIKMKVRIVELIFK